MRRVLLGLVCLGVLALGQEGKAAGSREMVWRGSGGWGAGLPYAQLFDQGVPIRASGNIARIERVVPLTGMAEGCALSLRTREQVLRVHLGPVWYLERQDFPLEIDDKVEVSGARTMLEGEVVLLATAVRKKDKILQLRNDKGLPLWSAWRNE